MLYLPESEIVTVAQAHDSRKLAHHSGLFLNLSGNCIRLENLKLSES